MNTSYWVITLSLTLLIIFTRFLPFIIGNLMSERFSRVGKFLPAYIMMLLVIYEIDINTLFKPPYGIPAFLALLGLLIVHLRLRNTFISLFCGTGLFIMLDHFLA